MKTQKGFSTVLGIIILLVIGVGVYWYINNESQIESLPEIQTNQQKELSDELNRIPNDVISPEENNSISGDTIGYELEDGEHFVFVTDYGVENGEPFLIFDKIQADFDNPENFPIFSNSNPLKRKLFLSRGSSYLGTATQVTEDYWSRTSISELGGRKMFDSGNKQNNIDNFINKNEIIVITVSENKIWSIRYIEMSIGVSNVDPDLKLKDDSYDGFYVNFFKDSNNYYLTFYIDLDGTVALKVNENAPIEMVNAARQVENISIEEFKKIAYDFERVWYWVSVDVKDNVIEKIKFYMPMP